MIDIAEYPSIGRVSNSSFLLCDNLSNMNYLKQSVRTPWKLFYEIKMYLFSPLIKVYLFILGVSFEKNSKFYGFPKVLKFNPSKIYLGKNFENRNWLTSNPLGINHPTIFTTWAKNAQIKIGNNVGISGGVISASTKIIIGDDTLIGANCTIIDTDFHPIRAIDRRYSKKNVSSKPIKIGKNVFIGMNSTILKGVTIGDNSVIAAGSVVRRSVPSNSVFVDNKIKKLK